MENDTIQITQLIGNELRSRTQANQILNAINEMANKHIILDFENVVFVSRSFADELCGIMEQVKASKEITLINEENIVKETLRIVMKNRNTKKIYKTPVKTITFHNMTELSNYFATI
jgi:anti-anti-sigma regulatory factor